LDVHNRLDCVWDAAKMRNILIRKGLGLALAILLGLVGVCALGQTSQAPATIMLIRHAEKLTDGQIHLSPQGFERAKAMPELFGTPAHPLPVPQVLFASHQSKNSNRPVETITPLSQALGLPIHADIDDKDIAGLAKELMSGKYAGKVVLVAWHHGSIPAIARALGAVPPYDPWPYTQFDRVWKIDYVGGKAKLTDVPQGLMAGDSK
jgi:broad specificity phosphatase PhoE